MALRTPDLRMKVESRLQGRAGVSGSHLNPKRHTTPNPNLGFRVP